MSFYESFLALPVLERERMAEEAGVSPAYLHMRVYTSPNREPKFKFHNAVALDKASGGLFGFMETAAGGEKVDWDHVFRRLASAKQKGLI